MINKERIIVICPGRGSYVRSSHNYLSDKNKYISKELAFFDNKRTTLGLKTISDLDKTVFRSSTHMAGEHASLLTYSCSLADFNNINRNKFDIIGVLGNSMGWYSALSLSGAISLNSSFNLIQTMGSMMKNKIIGGQIIYPIINKNWQIEERIILKIKSVIKNIDAHISIFLGGYIVIGGSQDSLDYLINELPKVDDYPFQIPFNAAFHTPLMKETHQKAVNMLTRLEIESPKIPLIDGLGKIWSPYSTKVEDLLDYTLKTQVISMYNFSKSVEVAIKELCPDKIVILGPGNSLGGPVGQVLIKISWDSITSKKDFIDKQKLDPFIISMGIPDQRKLVC